MKDKITTMLRLDQDVHHAIVNAAAENDRSRNSEINQRLRSSFWKPRIRVKMGRIKV